MAELEIWSLISSLTLIDGVNWRQDDFMASKMKKFVKLEDINGYFTISTGGNSTRFENKDRDKFLQILAKAVGKKMVATQTGNFCLVPIPNSDAISSNRGTYKTFDFCSRITASLNGQASVCDALRWKEVATSARAGGSRDPRVLQGNLELISKPYGPVMLFDDVMTSGGHMIACAKHLIEGDVDLRRGFAPIRASWSQKAKVVEWVSEKIDISPYQDDPLAS